MNVLLYACDALRADHVSCYGYDRETTPTLDALAGEGVKFDRCFTPATWTRPVAATLSTGLYPPAHGTRTRHDTLNGGIPTLAELFSDAGYQTVGITSMGNVSSATGFDRGFDEFHDLYRDEDLMERRDKSTATDEELTAEEGNVALPRAADINDAFVDVLDRRSDADPFFAFCWSIDPHVPYDPPPDYERFRDPDYDGPVDGGRDCLKRVDTDADLDQLKALYDEEIRYNDDCLGELVAALRDADELDETLVCVVGDHGDAFDEHGRLTHGHAPYDELVHVPWILRPPRGGEGSTVAELTSLVDVFPTLLDLADVSVPNRPDVVGGRSAAPSIRNDAFDGHDRVFFETRSYDMQNAFYGVRSDEWKYLQIERPEMNTSAVADLVRYVLDQGLLTDILRHPFYYWRRYRYDDRTRLFDLRTDPGEHNNLARERPERRDEFNDSLDSWLDVCQRFRARLADERAVIDGQTKDQLRQLGYAE